MMMCQGGRDTGQPAEARHSSPEVGVRYPTTPRSMTVSAELDPCLDLRLFLLVCGRGHAVVTAARSGMSGHVGTSARVVKALPSPAICPQPGSPAKVPCITAPTVLLELVHSDCWVPTWITHLVGYPS